MSPADNETDDGADDDDLISAPTRARNKPPAVLSGDRGSTSGSLQRQASTGNGLVQSLVPPSRVPHARRSLHLSKMIAKSQISIAAAIGAIDLENRTAAAMTNAAAAARRTLMILPLQSLNGDGDHDEEDDSDSAPEREQPASTPPTRGIIRRLSLMTEQTKNDTSLVEVRLQNYTYYVPVKMDAPTVPTVFNKTIFYNTYEVFRRVHRYLNRSKTDNYPELWYPQSVSDVVLPYAKKPILKDINLVFEPGKSYLILGPPGCGKTSLLKAIAGRLPNGKSPKGDPVKSKPHSEGAIRYNGVTEEEDPNLVLASVTAFVGQLDEHAPYLTVRETFEFALRSRVGIVPKDAKAAAGTSKRPLDVHAGSSDNDKPDSDNKTEDDSQFSENLTIEGLDLAVCADTFVGNSDVRGVSGGQRRRVTVGEMMQGQNPVACADEISTGLDAAVTYDIVHSIVAFSRAAKTTRIISLLQPGPETFSLFDEIVLLSEGHVIYAGPISEVVDYFASLGYKQPATMDVADFLQSIPTVDGKSLFNAASSPSDHHYSSEEFAGAFKKSDRYASIDRRLYGESRYTWADPNVLGKKVIKVPPEFHKQFQNSFSQSLKLNFQRHLTLWIRDKGFIIGKMFENIGMAVATGGILFGNARIPSGVPDDIVDADSAEKFFKLTNGVYGALFMTTFHILLGTMTSAPDEIDGRSIHYKHHDARFYQAFAFVFGRLASTIPQRSLEIVAFGIPLYWMVGLNPTAGSFFIYLALLICYTTGIKMMFSILAQTLAKKANVQGVGTFIVLLLSLFSGFIVYPSVIPDFYIWIYWSNPMAWALQSLLSNEFTSSRYRNIAIKGETFLTSRGFQSDPKWVWLPFFYMIPFTLLCTFILGIVLRKVRIEPERSHLKKKLPGDDSMFEDKNEINLPFMPVDLIFEKLAYEVPASKGKETLRLLNEINGVFKAGRMCALMGSSGAGKTTLMDVIAMRKASGTITGEIRLNGHLQERASFLRCSGYVEQFDVLQPELTVLETVQFCARLRLDETDPQIGNDQGKLRYADHVIAMMELTPIQDLQVGSFEEGGLTFEQRKRLAIACELAGSPSVIFLDEPTSGLDSRGAIVVMRAMKRIADSGRTVCATIHQPSSTVFEMFDDLLLLKKGGNVVFFGELGEHSGQLIEYFEDRGATAIDYGENPAAWMLRAFSGEGATSLDWSQSYKESSQYKTSIETIEELKQSPDETRRIKFENEFPTSFGTRTNLTCKRLLKIYKRSPSYTLARLMIAIFYAFIIGSVFLRRFGRIDVWEEPEVDAVIATMFLSLIIVGITSISMAVPVMKRIRDVFYKHRASGMVTHTSLSFGLFVSETPYVCMIALLFAVVYYATIGLFQGGFRFWLFWVFFVFNVAIYSFFGQAFICLVKDIPTAGALVGALVGYNVFFSGFIVKPQYFVGPFQIGFWTAPGRYALEGLIITQFAELSDPVIATEQTPYFFSLGCTVGQTEPCVGILSDFVRFYFGGRFTEDDFWIAIGVLFGYLFLAIFLTWFSLKRFNYVNT